MKNDFEELKEAAKPLVEYLKNKHGYGYVAIVTEERVDIMQEKMGMPIESIYFLK